MNSTNNFKQIKTVLKWIISIGVLVYVCYEFNDKFNDRTEIFNAERWFNSQSIALITLVLVLGVFNILIEAVKWKYLLKPFEKLLYKDAIASVFTGLSLAIVTPNRLGDFVGKAYQLNRTSAANGMFIAFFGHSAQYVIILVLGAWALGIFYSIQYLWLAMGVLILFLISILIYLNLPNFISLLGKVKMFKKIENSFSVLAAYSFKEKWVVLIYSFFKYLFFVSQFCLLLFFFHAQISVEQAVIGVLCTYLVQLFVPSFLLLELGVRGAAAVFFIGKYTTAIPEILAATYLLWTLNLALPAIIGLYFFNRKSHALH